MFVGNLHPTIRARDFERERLVAETQVLRRHKTGEENVDAFANGEGHGDDAVRPGLPVQAANEVGQVIEHGQIVLDDDDVRIVL